MALTLGRAPFGSSQSGVFNFKQDFPGAVLYWEDYPKRVRAVFNGKTVADSRSVKVLHETGRFIVFYFPRKDVKMDLLKSTDHQTECPHKGVASYWTVQAGGREAENAVWSYENPVESASFIEGYLAFVYDKMDAWYQEDEKIYVHPRSPYHRFDVHASSRHVVVQCSETTVAESTRPLILFETGLPPRYYLPPEDVRTDLLAKSDYVSQCPYKGDARHWNLTAGGATIEDAAWSLPDPLGEARRASGYFCFYPDKVSVEVDGELLKS